MTDETNLKFNVNKIRLFMQEAKWGGRIYSSTDVKHDPAHVEAIQQTPIPPCVHSLFPFLVPIDPILTTQDPKTLLQ